MQHCTVRLYLQHVLGLGGEWRSVYLTTLSFLLCKLNCAKQARGNSFAWPLYGYIALHCLCCKEK